MRTDLTETHEHLIGHRHGGLEVTLQDAFVGKIRLYKPDMGFRSSLPKEWDCLSNHRGGPVKITAIVPGYADDVLGRAKEMRVTQFLSRGEGLLNVNPYLLAMNPLRVGRCEDRVD